MSRLSRLIVLEFHRRSGEDVNVCIWRELAADAGNVCESDTTSPWRPLDQLELIAFECNTSSQSDAWSGRQRDPFRFRVIIFNTIP